MERCDALIVGGGPAGSSCAWRLARAGLDVMVWDRAAFPRDKVCAGWITPQAVADLELDLEAYSAQRTLQAISGFRVGVLGRSRTVAIRYGTPISYGIRRCEFDDYLLRRSGARLRLGEPVRGLRKREDGWSIDDRVVAPVLVGAGGHWCPVARLLNPDPRRHSPAAVVVAQEAEFPVPPAEAESFTTLPDVPELYFSPDFKGYAWIFRKRGHINIGVGSLDPHACPAATEAFAAELRARRLIPRDCAPRWHGHAYLVSSPPARTVSGDGVLLAGDAAGLAYPQSGEGIRPAIESGLMAAEAILAARGNYAAGGLSWYGDRLAARFRDDRAGASWSRLVPESVVAALGVRLLTVPWFVRRIVLDRWFLRRADAALAA